MSTKNIAIVVGCIAALGTGVVLLAGSLGGGDAIKSQSRNRVLIDSESLEVFESFPVPDGSVYPLKNPDTGENNLFPAERCHWTRDGKYTPEPTFVLLNSYKGVQGDTICPDCGRRVTGHNPMPPDHLIVE